MYGFLRIPVSFVSLKRKGGGANFSHPPPHPLVVERGAGEDYPDCGQTGPGEYLMMGSVLDKGARSGTGSSTAISGRLARQA